MPPARTGEEDAPTEAEVLRFFDLFLEQERPLDAATEHQEVASGGGWTRVLGSTDEDEEDKESVATVASSSGSGSDTSRCSSGVAANHGSDGDSGRLAARPPARASSSTRYQHRQRQELEYLKHKVRELEIKLRLLEREAAGGEDASMWQRVAHQQQVASQKATAENAMLRGMVAEQLRFSKSLEKAIRKRPLFGGDGDGASATTTAPNKRRQLLDDQALARHLRERVSQTHEQAERVMAESTIAGVTRDFHAFDIKARPGPTASAGHQLRLECGNVRRLPFHFVAVAREIWRFLSDAAILEQMMPGMKRRVELMGNELLATTDLTFPVGDRSALLHATAAFRLTIASSNAHFSWVSHGECRAKKSAKSSFQVIEEGWTWIEPLSGSTDACIIRTVNYHTPSTASVAGRGEDDDGKDDATPAEIGILTELISSAYDKSRGHIFAVIQNSLMEQVLRGKRAAAE